MTMTMLPAHKALWMKLPEHGGDAATLNGPVTVGADPGAKQRTGTGLAVRLTVSLLEVSRTKLHATAVTGYNITIIITIIIIIIISYLEQQNRSRRQVRPIAVIV